MHEQRGYDRIVFFSDAVVAIAVTLLILPLVEGASEVSSGGVGDLLTDDRNKFVAFAISFVVIAQYWTVHHRVFRNVARYTSSLVWANFLWLASIVFLPFPTELIGAKGDTEVAATTLYIGTLVVTSASLLLMQFIIVRRPELQWPDVRGRLKLLPSMLSTGGLLVALIAALAGGGLWALLLLIPATWSQRGFARAHAAAQDDDEAAAPPANT